MTSPSPAPDALHNPSLPLRTPLPSSTFTLQARIYSFHALVSNPTLSSTILDLVNAGFMDTTVYIPSLWTSPLPARFKTLSDLYETIGPKGHLAVIHNKDEVVACAIASPWKGDLFPDEQCEKVDTDGPEEVGWEIKAVTTKKGFNKLGLAGRCIDGLKKEIARVENVERVRLWVHTVNEVNGEYWRRRGWREVRRTKMPIGLWGSVFGFWLVVMYMDIDVDVGEVREDKL
jgi:hypothetical protein